jgi:hypothetical protein
MEFEIANNGTKKFHVKPLLWWRDDDEMKRQVKRLLKKTNVDKLEDGAAPPVCVQFNSCFKESKDTQAMQD